MNLLSLLSKISRNPTRRITNVIKEKEKKQSKVRRWKSLRLRTRTRARVGDKNKVLPCLQADKDTSDCNRFLTVQCGGRITDQIGDVKPFDGMGHTCRGLLCAHQKAMHLHRVSRLFLRLQAAPWNSISRKHGQCCSRANTRFPFMRWNV